MKAKQREWAKASRARKKEAKKASDPQPEPSSVPAAPLESDPQPEVELPSSRESSPSASNLQPVASQPSSPQSDDDLLSSPVPPSDPTPLPRKRRAPTPDDATEDSEQDVAVSSTSQR